MSNFIQFFIKNRELIIIKQKQYIKQTDFLKYLGHDEIQSIILETTYYNGETYINIANAKELMATHYNKNNPEVVQYHKEMGFTDMEYTMSARTLSPVVNTVNKFSSTISNVGNDIGSSIGSTIEKSKNNITTLFNF